jgi:hypothetical protein
LYDEGFRSQLLERMADPTIPSYFQHVYAKLKQSEQIRRAALLTDLLILRYSWKPAGCLAVYSLLAMSRQPSAVLTQKSGAPITSSLMNSIPSPPSQRHPFPASSMLSQTRKYGLYLCLAHHGTW